MKLNLVSDRHSISQQPCLMYEFHKCMISNFPSIRTFSVSLDNLPHIKPTITNPRIDNNRRYIELYINLGRLGTLGNKSLCTLQNASFMNTNPY